MKINKILLGAFALSMTFASCSNDEPAKGPNEGGNTDGEKYVAVRIQSASDNASRADEAGEGFEVGIGSENTVTAENVRFYFFINDGRPFVMNSVGVNGEVTPSNMVKPYELNTVINTDGTPGSIDGMLVLGTPAEGYKGNSPAYVVCVANPTSTMPFSNFANKKLQNLIKEWNAAPKKTADDLFAMTSSTYVDGGKIVYWTDLNGKIETSASAAKKNPADIYLERLVSKVRVSEGIETKPVQKFNATASKYENATFDISVLGENNKVSVNKNVNLEVQLTGWQLRNTATGNYCFKNLDEDWLTTAPFENWYSTTLHRSYWTMPYSQSAGQIENKTFSLKEGDKQFPNKNFSSASPKENIVYCYENTIQSEDVVITKKDEDGNVVSTTVTTKAETNREVASTAIIVRGIVKLQGTDTGLNLCEWGGQYYTEEALQQTIADNYNSDKDETAKITRDKVEFKEYNQPGARSNTYYAVINGTIHGDYRYNNIRRWIGGVTSYNVNIKHNSTLYGIVRNHIYDYKLTNVVGLGVPGEQIKNPDPETETYLAARVHVLNWRVVSNNVTLE